MFTFFKEKFTKVYAQFSSKVQELLAKPVIDQTTIQELSKILLAGDIGVKTTRFIIDILQNELKQEKISTGSEAKKVLETQLVQLLDQPAKQLTNILLLVGVNGSGKTTAAGKLAHRLITENKKVLIIAADTFRAAAVEQIEIWAHRAGAEFFAGKPGQDPSSVVFAGCRKFQEEKFDTLIIDTAGRLQTKAHLVQELEKIKRTITKQLPDEPITTLLVIDAMIGQNSFQQAKIFNEATAIDGIILTKLDGTGKGGIVFSIAQELKIPVLFISTGEQMQNLEPFDAPSYVSGLLN